MGLLFDLQLRIYFNRVDVFLLLYLIEIMI